SASHRADTEAVCGDCWSNAPAHPPPPLHAERGRFGRGCPFGEPHQHSQLARGRLRGARCVHVWRRQASPHHRCAQACVRRTPRRREGAQARRGADGAELAGCRRPQGSGSRGEGPAGGLSLRSQRIKNGARAGLWTVRASFAVRIGRVKAGRGLHNDGGWSMKRWIEETFHPHWRVGMEADKILHEEKTEHQHLVIFENAVWGTVLILDGVFQLTTLDEFIYHEMMAHVPLMALERPRRVLVIGGGDGGVLREVLKHPSVEKATLCEIDRSVIDLSLKYYPQVSNGAFDNPRAEIVIADGLKYVAETTEKF